MIAKDSYMIAKDSWTDVYWASKVAAIMRYWYLRAVVSNFRESGDTAENSNSFLFAQKTLLMNYFEK